MKVMTLKIVLEPGEDGMVIASVPALPGCHSQGLTRDEALENIREAVVGWLESQDTVEPGPAVEVVKIAV